MSRAAPRWCAQCTRSGPSISAATGRRPQRRPGGQRARRPKLGRLPRWRADRQGPGRAPGTVQDKARRVPIAGDTRISNMVFERSTGLRVPLRSMRANGRRGRVPRLPRDVEEPRDPMARRERKPAARRARRHLRPGRGDRARQRRAAVVDSSGEPGAPPRERGMLAKPSVRELEEVDGRPWRTSTRRAAIQGLIRSGAAELLAVTLGEEGALPWNSRWPRATCRPLGSSEGAPSAPAIATSLG